MSPKRTRKYRTTFKTTTKRGKKEYMRKYMRDYVGIPRYRYRKRGTRKRRQKA